MKNIPIGEVLKDYGYINEDSCSGHLQNRKRIVPNGLDSI